MDSDNTELGKAINMYDGTRRLRTVAGLSKMIADRKHRINASSRIWTHYDNALEKHPYFCDRISIGNSRSIVTATLRGYRNVIKEQAKKGELYWGNVLNCEMMEVIEALERGNDPAAVEECYDVIAVMLRVIDVLEGRQPLGKPAPKTPTPPPKQTPPKSSAAPGTARKGKTADGNYEYPPIDPDCGVMFCRCPGHEPGCAACMMCKDWREYRNRYIRNVNDGLPEYKRPHRDARLLTDEMADMACEFIKYLLKVGQYG